MDKKIPSKEEIKRYHKERAEMAQNFYKSIGLNRKYGNIFDCSNVTNKNILKLFDSSKQEIKITETYRSVNHGDLLVEIMHDVLEKKKSLKAMDDSDLYVYWSGMYSVMFLSGYALRKYINMWYVTVRNTIEQNPYIVSNIKDTNRHLIKIDSHSSLDDLIVSLYFFPYKESENYIRYNACITVPWKVFKKSEGHSMLIPESNMEF